MQILFAAVTLGGYAAHFAPELLSLLCQRSTGKNSKCAEPGENLASVADMDVTGSAPLQNRFLDGSLKPGVRLRKNTGQQSSIGDGISKVGTDVYVKSDAEILCGGVARGQHLLDPNMLWLCGSFTLQVRNFLDHCILRVLYNGQGSASKYDDE